MNRTQMVRQVADRYMPNKDYRVLINGPNCDLNCGGGVEYFIEGSNKLTDVQKRDLCYMARSLPGVVDAYITRKSTCRFSKRLIGGNVRIRFGTRANGKPAAAPRWTREDRKLARRLLMEFIATAPLSADAS